MVHLSQNCGLQTLTRRASEGERSRTPFVSTSCSRYGKEAVDGARVCDPSPSLRVGLVFLAQHFKMVEFVASARGRRFEDVGLIPK